MAASCRLSRNAAHASENKGKRTYCTALRLSSLLRPGSNTAGTEKPVPMRRETALSIPIRRTSSDPFLLRNLDQHCGRQLSPMRNQFVVDLYFKAHLVDVGNVFSPQHLLNLK